MVETALKHGVDGIAFTYSEPAVWLEYVLDVSRLAHQAGLFTVYVSNSFVTDEALELMAPHIDVLCSDIKSLSAEFYKDICPVSTVDQVLGSIRRAAELGIHVETRTNVIPTKNDNLEELAGIAEWIHDNLGADSPWHVTKFFPAYQLSHLPATENAIIDQAAAAGRAAGLSNVYGHTDISCDCATENAPVSAWMELDADALNTVKACAAPCCGDEGILVKKFEREAGLIAAQQSHSVTPPTNPPGQTFTRPRSKSEFAALTSSQATRKIPAYNNLTFQGTTAEQLAVPQHRQDLTHGRGQTVAGEVTDLDPTVVIERQRFCAAILQAR